MALLYTETGLYGILQSSITSSATSIPVIFYDRKTGTQRTPQSNTLLFVIDKGTAQVPNKNYEIILCSSHSTNGTTGVTTLTVSARGLPLYGTSVSAGTGSAHVAGAEIGCVDVHLLWNLATAKLDGTVAMENALNMGGYKITSLGTPSANTDAATKAYVDGVAVAGAPDMNTTTKGIGEQATDAELQAGTATGSTGAPTVATGGSFTQTATANKVPVARSSGKIDDGWLGLTTAGDIVYSDGTDLQRLAVGTSGQTLKGGTSPAWGTVSPTELTGVSANVTASNLNSLTGGSDGGSLHYHDVKYGSAAGNSSTTQTIAHGLGRTPKIVRIDAAYSDNVGDNLVCQSHGVSNGTTHHCIVGANDGSGGAFSGRYSDKVLKIVLENGTLVNDATAALDSTNITLTWNNSTNSTIEFTWEVS